MVVGLSQSAMMLLVGSHTEYNTHTGFATTFVLLAYA